MNTKSGFQSDLVCFRKVFSRITTVMTYKHHGLIVLPNGEFQKTIEPLSKFIMSASLTSHLNQRAYRFTGDDSWQLQTPILNKSKELKLPSQLIRRFEKATVTLENSGAQILRASPHVFSREVVQVLQPLFRVSDGAIATGTVPNSHHNTFDDVAFEKSVENDGFPFALCSILSSLRLQDANNVRVRVLWRFRRT